MPNLFALALIEFDSKNEPIQPWLIDALEGVVLIAVM